MISHVYTKNKHRLKVISISPFKRKETDFEFDEVPANQHCSIKDSGTVIVLTVVPVTVIYILAVTVY